MEGEGEKDERSGSWQWRGNQMRLVMTSNGNDRMGGGAGSGDDTPSKGWLNRKIIKDSEKLAIVRGDRGNRGNPDRYPTDWVKKVELLAERRGEENRRLDNPFNIWACSCALRRSILSEARVSAESGGREVAVVVHAVFLFKVLRLKVFDLVGWVEVIAENLKIIGSLRQ
ncbi:hypothetical protein BY996DRAFT_6613713 [Phakopsora pachyrhizi]|nr:hypothetical protein BY996DRAFT_6613713 [Phakopsora pachyrhizi]